MNDNMIIEWLLDGDVSIQYQVHRDLRRSERPRLRKRIAKEGWGVALLSRRREDGHWGRGFYQPKWTSTHYVLLDLMNLGIAPETPEIRETIDMILTHEKEEDGGINPGKTIKVSDACINGMVLKYASYFGADEEQLKSIVDFLLVQQMEDGGFNCQYNRSGATHSSLHTTLSIAEGILGYSKCGYSYRLKELQSAEKGCRRFMLQHSLFKSDRTGEIIDKKMLMLSYPSRWRYDILRALDYFRYAAAGYDKRMDDAIDVLLKKRRKDGR